MALSLSGKRVLVTGGAGFIGSHLVDRIIQDSPEKIVVVDNFFLGRMQNLGCAQEALPDLKVVKMDASDYEAMKKVIRENNIDVVFNLAVVPLPTSLSRPRWTVDTNVAIATVACEILREGYFETLVHFSSSEVYGSAVYVPMNESHPWLPSTPYAASKAAGDHIVLSYRKAFGVDAFIVRPFNNFGPRQNDGAFAGVIPTVIRNAQRGKAITIHGGGEQTRDFVFVGDVCEVAVRAYQETTTRGEIINVASGQEVTINCLVRTILLLLDRDVEVRYGEARAGDVQRHLGGIDKVERLIGFRPTVSLEDGLRKTVQWYRLNSDG